MLKKTILSVGLSVFAMSSEYASAMDDLVVDYQPSQASVIVLNEPVVQPSLKERAYNAADKVGLVDLGKGAVNLGTGAGRVTKDGVHALLAAGSTAVAAGNIVLYPFSYMYSGADAAQKNWQNAKDFGFSAYDHAKTAVTDMPANATNAKDGVIDLYQGGKKLVGSLYEGAKVVANSGAVQNAWAGVKGWFGKAYEVVSSAASNAKKQLKPFNFDNVDFS